jgi:hypothetical protein
VDDWLAQGGDINNADPKVVSYVNRIMGGGPGQPGAPNAPRPITPGGQQAAGSAALGGGVTPPGAAPGATPGAVPSAPPATIPAGATATAPDPSGLRRVLNKGQPYTTGAPPGYQWAVDQNRQWHVVPIRGGPEAAGTAGFGNSAEGRAAQALVDEGILTRAQAAAWLAGKTVNGPNGQVDFLTPGRGLTTLRQGQQSAQEREDIKESDNSVAALQSAVDGLRQAADLNAKSFQGAGADLKTWLDRNVVPGDWGGEDTTVFNTLIRTQALQLLKPTFGGNPTEGERKAAEQLVASLDKSIEERRRVLKLGIEAAEGRLKREKARAEAMRAGTYYKEGIREPDTSPQTDAGAYAQMSEDQLKGIDHKALNPQQKAAYLAALRAANERKAAK